MNRSMSTHTPSLREQRISAIRNSAKKATPVAKVLPAQQKESPLSVTRTCAVLNCEHYKSLPDKAFYRFPEEPSLRSVWTEVTGRTGWTPNDYSFVCQVHFTPDCLRRSSDGVVLEPGSVPTLKLPHHVMEVEYIDEEMLEAEIASKESETDQDIFEFSTQHKSASTIRLELLKLFTQVQNNQNQIVNLRKRLLHDKQVLRTRNRDIGKLQEKLKKKERLLQKKAASKNINELNQVMIMPTRYTEDVKNLALNIYSYSAEAYIYLRNTLRTVLPSTDVLDEWLASGFKPKKVMSNSDCLKVVTEAKPTELSCKVSIV